jgi:hypothetical protein
MLVELQERENLRRAPKLASRSSPSDLLISNKPVPAHFRVVDDHSLSWAMLPGSAMHLMLTSPQD